jgi:hypothetical protein
VLVIVTDEVFLDVGTVEQFLAGANFSAQCIDDVFGLSYHPGVGGRGGRTPAVRLKSGGPDLDRNHERRAQGRPHHRLRQA